MNFLGHYFVDRNSTPPYALGLILPDIARNFFPGTKLDFNRETPTSWSSDTKELLDGCMRHIQVDKVFHVTAHFKSYQYELYDQMLRAEFEDATKYLNFLAHITVELVLDRVIMKDNPGIGEEFYKKLEQVQEQTIQEFFNQQQLPELEQGFYQHLQQFNKEQYLLYYIDNESLIYSLNRIYSETTKHSFSEGDKIKLNNLLITWEEMIHSDYQVLIEELKAC